MFLTFLISSGHHLPENWGMLKKVILASVLFAAVSCSRQEEGVNDGQASEVTAAPEKDGRVEANEATTRGISAMKQTLGQFRSGGEHSSYTDLQASLDSTFQDILQKCTMKGEDHQRLHEFLEPVPGMTRGIADPDQALADRNIRALADHLDTYDRYFK
jgi:hypothetical protein